MNNPKLVFDIGCNRGNFYEYCLARFPKCKVIAVDANDSFIWKSDIERLELIHAALSNKDGLKVDLLIDPRQLGISTLSEKWTQESRFAKGNKYLPPGNSNWTLKKQVYTTTLDKLIEQYGEPQFIKIDVEGHEEQVLLGLTKKPANCLISFEFSEELYSEVFKCIQHLINLGFVEFGLSGYFEDGKHDWATLDPKGDTFVKTPKVFLSAEEFLNKFVGLIVPDRNIVWGMIYAK